MRYLTNSKNPLIIFITLVLVAGQSLPASAQAYLGQLNFLEQFAVRMYNRGDYPQATQEFERILKIDPANGTAAAYLERIASAPRPPVASGKTSLERLDEMSEDITALRQVILGYENESRGLESLIRTLITENDDLYMALYKRTRELIELRAKVYGLAYSDEYIRQMKDMPIDRVPQRLYHPEDLLPAYTQERTISVNIPPEQILSGYVLTEKETLERYVAEKRMAARKSGQAPALQMIPEQREILGETRELTLEKTLTLAERKQNLIELQDKVQAMNTKLRDANDRYLEAINKIDRYYKSIKAEIAEKNFRQQNRPTGTQTITVTTVDQRALENAERAERSYRNMQAELAERDSRRQDRPAETRIITTTTVDKRDLDEAKRADRYYQDIKTEVAERNFQRQNRPTGTQTITVTTVDQRALENAERAERSYRNMQAELAERTFKEQNDLLRLTADLTDRIREIETLKRTMKVQDSELLSYKTSLAAQSQKLSEIEASIRAKDIQIKAFKFLLLEYKNVIRVQAEDLRAKTENIRVKEADIRAKTEDIRFTREQLDIAEKKISSIEKLLADNDKDMNSLKAESSKARALALDQRQRNEESLLELEKTSAETDRKILAGEDEISSLRKESAALAERIRERDASLAEAKRLVDTFKKEIASLKDMEGQRSELMSALNARLDELDRLSGKRSDAFEEQKRKLADMLARIDAFEKETAELRLTLSRKRIRLSSCFWDTSVIFKLVPRHK